MALTPKQEKFIQGVVSGMTYSDAYRAAYNCVRMKPETVNNKAYELMHKGEISARVEKARAEAAKNAQWSLDLAVERVRKLNDELCPILRKTGFTKALLPSKH